MPLNNPNLVMNWGEYVGDDTNLRAIPHGLGSTPTLVIIICLNDNGYNIFVMSQSQTEYMVCVSGIQTTQAMDSTNFYVGNLVNTHASANNNAKAYQWVAFVI